MKRIISLGLVLISYLLSFGEPIKFVGCHPANGSAIDSFNFKLEFDIEDALREAKEQYPDWTFGVGCKGNDPMNTSLINPAHSVLYKGEVKDGIVLDYALTSNIGGQSPEFVENGNTISMVFDDNIPVVSGQTYTIVITNIFDLCVGGRASRFMGYGLNCLEDPLILTFTGGTTGKPQLDVTDSSLKWNDSVDTMGRMELTLNSPFDIRPGAEAVIREGEEIVGSTSSLSVSSSSDRILLVDFDDIPLLNSHTYTILLPAGSVSMKEEAAVGNYEYSVMVRGSHKRKVPLTFSKVDVTALGIPEAISFIYDMPEGTIMNDLMQGSDDGYLTEMASGESSTQKGVMIDNGKGLRWNLSTVSLRPGTEYRFSKPGDTFFVQDMEGLNGSLGLLWEYMGEDAEVVFTTPSIEEVDVPGIPLGVAKTGRYDVESTPYFIEGGSYASIDVLEIMKEQYEFGGKSYSVALNWDENPEAYVYDVTDGTRRLVKQVTVSNASREPDEPGFHAQYAYAVYVLPLKMEFLQDHTYEIVIPRGTMRLNDTPHLFNYVLNDETVYVVKGAVPAEFKVESCSVDDGAKMHQLPPAIVWTLNGSYRLRDMDVTAMAKKTGTEIGNSEYPVTLRRDGYKTYVTVHPINSGTNDLPTIKEGNFLTLTLPAGSIVYAGDESLANPELRLTIEGVAPPVEETMVRVTLTVNGVHASEHYAAKGQQYRFNFRPAEGWEVSGVKQSWLPLTAGEDGTYVTTALNSDTPITATLRYAGPWAFEDTTTGIWSVEGSDIKIYRDGDMIVVEGVAPDNLISVYTAGGLLINSSRVAHGNDKATITVAPGQVYIVTVDGTAAKIRM